MTIRRMLSCPGLGDAILAIFWNRKLNVQLCAREELYREDLFWIMGERVERTLDAIEPAGHGWPVKIEPIAKTTEPPIIQGHYMTWQFNASSVYPGNPSFRKFNASQLAEIRLKYRDVHFVSIEDKSQSLHEVQNMLQHSAGHVGCDSGMAWFAILCGVPVDVWYNGWSEACSFDNNWLLNYIYNGASVKMLS